MVRFQDQATAFLATAPLGQQVANLPPEKNVIDKHVFSQLKQLGLPPSEVSSDSTFIRRVTLDIAGRLPKYEETVEFLQSNDPNKREVLVDQLLETNDYANYFAQKVDFDTPKSCRSK